jgi:hypothetical protein
VLVFSNGFLLAEAAADRPLTHARIGYQTWTRDLAAVAVTVSSEDAEGPKDAPLRPDTYEFWAPTALPATWTVDLGAGRDLDYVGLVHTLGSAGCAVLVETSDGSQAGSPLEQVWTTFASEISPGSDDPLLFLDDSVTARYLRLTITGGSTMPTIAVVYAGEVLAMPRPLWAGHAPMNLARETLLTRNLSRGGQFLGQSFVRHGQVGAAAWRHLEPDWYRASFDPFVEAARQYPFFFAWRPADYPLEVAYAWALADIRPSNMGVRDFVQVGFDLHGIGHE